MGVRALIFDVDGTLAETEELHRIAFNRTFAEAGLPWSWDRDLYRELLKVAGGRERIEAHAQRIDAQNIDAPALHRRKTEIYSTLMAPGTVELRPGSFHMMFLEVKEPFREGGTVPVTLTFEKAGTVEAELTVMPFDHGRMKMNQGDGKGMMHGGGHGGMMKHGG